MVLSVLGCLVVFAWPQQMSALSSIPSRNAWITNGKVNAIVTTDTTVYLGGAFTYVGPNSGSGTPLNASTGAPVSNYPRVDGGVFAVVPDGAGGWYIGGDFMRVGTLERNRIAHILADGSVDESWNPDANSLVMTLAVSGSTVYAGGFFTSIGGQPRNFIAALDAATGNATLWNPGANLTVYALATSGSTVYAGGDFTTIGGQPRNRIAALDAATGSAASWNPGANLTVYSLAVSGSTVYAGGDFTSIGGQPQNFIAALDASTGNASAWNPNANQPVATLAVSGSTVYAGGYFTSIGGQPRNYIAALDAATGNASAWNPNANLTVSALAVSGSTVFAGGDFTSIGGQPRNYIAALDAATGNAAAWNPNADQTVSALAINGSTIYAGGYFSSIGRQRRNRIAALDAASGQATSWNPNADAVVSALAVSGSTVYAGGEFATIGGAARNHLAALDAATGSATSWDPNADGAVKTLAVSGVTVYAGGEFATIGGAARNHLAALDATTGSAAVWNPSADDAVHALAVSGPTVYAGGEFTNIGAQSTQPARNHIAALDVATGNATSWNPNADGLVRALTVSGSTVYAGGDFTKIGGVNQSFIAALDAATGDAIAWDPNADATIRTLLVNDSTLYAGGDFSLIGGQSRNYLAALETLTALATPWDPNVGFSVHTLAATANNLYAGGEFLSVGGEVQPYLAQFCMGFSVSGTVTSGGAGFPGVTLALTGAATKSAVTDGNGNYSFSGLSDGIYAITPGKAGYLFTPPEREMTVAGADVSGQDFAVSATVPAAPTGVTATAGNGQATVSFTPPASDGGSPITSFTVTSKPGGKTVSGAGSPLTVTGLTNGTAYTFTVTATNAVGAGPASSPSNSVTPTGGPGVPGAPTGVAAIAGNAQSKVSFTAPASDGGSPILSYKVTSSPGGKTAKGTSSPITVKGLTNGTAYTFKVRATNAVGTGPASSPSNSVTPAKVPGSPTGVTATPGNAQATVSFTAPASDGGSPILSYKVTSNPGGKTATGKSSPLTVKGLTNGTAYTFTVKATNALGTGPASSPSNSMTPGYTISGTVTSWDPTLSGVIVSLTGTATRTTTTDSSGKYSFTGLANGDYTITLNKDGYTFKPSSKSAKVSNGNVTGKNFTATPIVSGSHVFGTVTTGDGTPLPTVVVTLGGAATGGITTDSEGEYLLTGVADGYHKLTPTRIGYTFTPPDRMIDVSGKDVTGQDFTATFTGYSLSGRITNGGFGVPGVTLALSGAATASAISDAEGNYSLSGLSEGIYTVTPSTSGHTLYPQSRSVRVLNTDVEREDFAASLEESITRAMSSIDAPDTGQRLHFYGSLPAENEFIETLFPEIAALVAAGSAAVPEIVPKFAGYPPYSQDSALVVYARVLSKIGDRAAVSALADFLRNNLTGEVFASIHAATHALKSLTGQKDPYNGTLSYMTVEVLDTIEQAQKWLEEHPDGAPLGELLAGGPLGAGAQESCHVGIFLTDQNGTPLQWTDPGKNPSPMDFDLQISRTLGYAFDDSQNASICRGGGHYIEGDEGDMTKTGKFGICGGYTLREALKLWLGKKSESQVPKAGWKINPADVFRKLWYGNVIEKIMEADIEKIKEPYPRYLVFWHPPKDPFYTNTNHSAHVINKMKVTVQEPGAPANVVLLITVQNKDQNSGVFISNWQSPHYNRSRQAFGEYESHFGDPAIYKLKDKFDQNKPTFKVDTSKWNAPDAKPGESAYCKNTTLKIEGVKNVSSLLLTVTGDGFPAAGADTGSFTLPLDLSSRPQVVTWVDPPDNNTIQVPLILPLGKKHVTAEVKDASGKVIASDGNNFRLEDKNFHDPEPVPLKFSTHSLSGTVRMKDGKEVPDAAIELKGTLSKNGTTDADGKYSFPALLDGNYTITPSKPAWNCTFNPPKSPSIPLKTDKTQDFTATCGWSIKGKVETNDAKPLALKSVPIAIEDANGTALPSATTDYDGKYEFSNLLPGTYTMTPSEARYNIAPKTIKITKGDEQWTFKAELITYSIFGKVKTNDAKPLPLGGVVITLSDGKGTTATTDGEGKYRFSKLVPGTYTMTPSKAQYNIDAKTVEIKKGDVEWDFTAVRITYSISGKVKKSDNKGLGDVAVSLEHDNGTALPGTTTDNDGEYKFSNLLPGTYKVSPRKDNYLIGSAKITIVDGNETQDFTALPIYSIKGRVVGSDNSTGVPEVTIDLSGAATRSTQTDGSGNFGFAGLTSGNYSLKPKKDECSTITPTNLPVTLSDKDIAGIKFTAVCSGGKRVHYEIYRDGALVTKGDFSGLQGTIPVSYSYSWDGGYANMNGSVDIAPASETPSGCSSWGLPSLTIDATATWSNQGLGFCRDTGIFRSCEDDDEGACTRNDNDKGCVDNGSFGASMNCVGCCLNNVYFYGFKNCMVELTLTTAPPPAVALSRDAED